MLIDGYRNLTGEHCGSTAMRNLLYHYCDLDLSEEVVFSLVYLDYRDFKVHFPGHRYVLLGYDDEDEVAFVADRLDPEPQRCSYEALRLSRNPPEFISTYNLWGKFFGNEVSHTLEEAFAHALAANARRMLGEDTAALEVLRATSEDPSAEISMGLPGVAAFLDDLPDWQTRDDRRFLTKYASDCIEKFGTGGGNFRLMYAEFLREGRSVVPELVPEQAPGLAARAAAQWTELATHLAELADDGGEAASDRAVHAAGKILETETELFQSIAERARVVA
jgi:hypothetical protein